MIVWGRERDRQTDRQTEKNNPWRDRTEYAKITKFDIWMERETNRKKMKRMVV